jgi:hypothetical protein
MSFVEQLLFEEEGVALDFKSAQYEFVGASDEAKAELLKDILAFANSWRRADAYILLGIAEVKGGRGQVVGISSHIDDAQLQQFVNSKVQRPIQLSYTAMQLDGKGVAVIHIPLQERPFYLQRDYGRLKADTVYIRRGSATVVARPDEVARMGRPADDSRDIALDVFFADPATRKAIVPAIRSLVLTVPDKGDIPEYHARRGPSYFSSIVGYPRAEYYRELVNFTRTDRLVAPVHFAISNSGGTPVQDVRIEIRVPGALDGVTAIDDDEFPSVPKTQTDIISAVRLRTVHDRIDMTARQVGEDWLVEARATKVQPRSTVWFRDAVFIGAATSRQIELHVTVFADNLAQPHRQTLKLAVEAVHESVTLDRILELEKERFTSSAVHQAFLREHGFSDGIEA